MLRIAFAGGATGGHLFPGIALAEHIAENLPEAEILFLCTDREFDRAALSAEGWPFVPLPSAPLAMRRIHVLASAALRSVATSVRLLRDKDLLVGLGGHGSAAPILAARILGIPYVLLEQNSIPGRVTRLFCATAEAVYSQWGEARRYLHGAPVKIAGSPLRTKIRPVGREAARRALGIPPDVPVLAVLGGSQGATTLNERVISSLGSLNGLSRRWHVVHLTGARDYERVRDAYAGIGLQSTVLSFTREMSLIYEASDLVVCRAGGLTIQELAFFGRPAILVPYPHAADDHQHRNASILKAAGCADLICEREISPGFLRGVLVDYLANKHIYEARGERLRSFFPQNCKDVFLADVRWRYRRKCI